MIGSVSTATNGVALTAQKDGLAKAAKQFEAVFLRQMIGSMRQATLADDVFGSSASEQFRDMQDGRLADNMADSGGFGIAQMLLKQFETNPAAAAAATGTATTATTTAPAPTPATITERPA
ncbi:MAG TPA: rod-binding protein [Sphingomonas sp.]|jgi:flagellar protein FlgJ|uniref:rod-binding protein n=1 Tax=Sphingomonas sp. TaxID=28214 RepID=UPI002EDB5C36